MFFNGLFHTALSGKGGDIEPEYPVHEAAVDLAQKHIRQARLQDYIHVSVCDLKELDLKGKSDYRKIQAIHDYLCDNIEYDTEKSGDDKGGTEHTAYGALVEGKSVCQGYAISLYRLLLEAGVDCRVIDGQGLETGGLSSAHSWNIVSIGGVYFYVDTTWDDSSGSKDYFLKNRDDFETDHVMSEEYDKDFVTEQYPVSQSGYPVDYDTPIKALNKATASFLDAFKQLDAA